VLWLVLWSMMLWTLLVPDFIDSLEVCVCVSVSLCRYLGNCFVLFCFVCLVFSIFCVLSSVSSCVSMYVMCHQYICHLSVSSLSSFVFLSLPSLSTPVLSCESM